MRVVVMAERQLPGTPLLEIERRGFVEEGQPPLAQKPKETGKAIAMPATESQFCNRKYNGAVFDEVDTGSS